jgi:hypothetical protein
LFCLTTLLFVGSVTRTQASSTGNSVRPVHISLRMKNLEEYPFNTMFDPSGVAEVNGIGQRTPELAPYFVAAHTTYTIHILYLMSHDPIIFYEEDALHACLGSIRRRQLLSDRLVRGLQNPKIDRTWKRLKSVQASRKYWLMTRSLQSKAVCLLRTLVLSMNALNIYETRTSRVCFKSLSWASYFGK